MKSDFPPKADQPLAEQFFNLPPSVLRTSHPLATLVQELIIRGFSRRTVKSYLAYNQRFLVFVAKSAREVDSQDVKNFLLFLKTQNYTNTSLNLVISALKFYYEQVLKRRLFFSVVRPKREKHLPQVLAKNQIQSLITAAANIKHQLILSLLYGSGLRVSEVVTLEIRDLDLANKFVLVRGAKGGKDRYTLLSQASLELAKKYLAILPIKQKYLFAGAAGVGHLTSRSAQKIFEHACVKVGIKTDVSCHSLRHSFATHLLESGVSIRYIQKLLGHNSLKTTEIYTSVARDFWENIKSPLD